MFSFDNVDLLFVQNAKEGICHQHFFLNINYWKSIYIR